MFNSLFSLVGRVLALFVGAPQAGDSNQGEAAGQGAEEQTQDEITQEVTSQSGRDEAQLLSEEDAHAELDHIEVDEVEMLSSDWDGQIPKRHSTLFPQAPSRAPRETTSNTKRTAHVGTQEAQQLSERATPRAHQLFAESERLAQPQPAPQRVTHEYLQPAQRPEPTAHVASTIPQGRAYDQVEPQQSFGRVMKRERRDDRYPEYSDILTRSATEDLDPFGHADPRRPNQVMSEHGTYPLASDDASGALGHTSDGAQRSDYQAVDYHELSGERIGGTFHIGGRRKRRMEIDVTREMNVVTPRSSIASLSLSAQPIPSVQSGGVEQRAVPALKPKPVRFQRGDYLRSWGNYSAQPSYLHFGSLVRSERFIDLLPIWYNDLDELEEEARKEWEHLEGELPSEGESDWRRLLNPTMSSPVDFLLHRDRAEQIQMLPQKRMF